MSLLFSFCARFFPYIVVVFAVLGVFILGFSNKQIFIIGVSVLVAWAASFFLKVTFKRIRPNNTRAKAPFLAESIYSFPSEHATIFSALGGIMYFINVQVGILFIVFAGLIGVSRARIKIHFWSDILAGWILGFIIGFLFSKLL